MGWGLSLGRPLRLLCSFTSGSGNTTWCMGVVGKETRGASLDQVLKPKDLAMLKNLDFTMRVYASEKKKRRKRRG